MQPDHHRSPARLIAPAALLAFVLAVALVVLGSGGSDDKGEGKAASTGRTTSASTPRAQPAKRPTKSATYTVRPGDSLGRIAEKTGIEVQTLQTLNPSLDPQALIAGQKIKLRR